MGEMVERVARALRGYIHEDREAPGAIDAAARAAIEAMREPTDAMLDEVCTNDTSMPTIVATDEVMRSVYRDMIDAALS